MGSISRKIRRNKAKKFAKNFTKQLRNQIGMFDKLGDQCVLCAAPFDKKSKEQAGEWRVAIYKEKKKVNLYCPKCWTTAEDRIEQERSENDNRISQEGSPSQDSDEGEPI
jgi:uncharacterized protein with PIN domain